MPPRIYRLHGLDRLSTAHFIRPLAQPTRLVHSSSRRPVSLPSTPPVSSQLLSAHPPPAAPSRAILGRLPTSSVLRSYLITRMSSSPALLALCFAILRRMLDSKSYLTSIERNPLLSSLLKSTFYAQFCAGENKSEVVRSTSTARNRLGYDGIMLEYALEVLGGSAPTAAETAQEIATWRKGMLESIDMVREGDFVGLKWSGLGRQALALLKAEQDPTPEMWEAITAACDAAAAKNIALLPGAEEEATNLGLEKWTLALQKKYNTPQRGRAVVYTTYQCYLKSVPERVAQLLAAAQKDGFIVGVKLVRGAYLSSEPRHLIWETKEGTDACYDACAEAVLNRQWTDRVAAPSPGTPFPAVNILLATHNAASLQKAQKIRSQQLLSAPPDSLPMLFYVQLLGMADEISQALVHDPAKHADIQAKVIKCMTWGTTTQCLNFLLRRASENKEAAMRTDDTRRAMGAELWRRMKVVFRLA